MSKAEIFWEIGGCYDHFILSYDFDVSAMKELLKPKVKKNELKVKELDGWTLIKYNPHEDTYHVRKNDMHTKHGE